MAQEIPDNQADPLKDLGDEIQHARYTWFPHNLETLDHWIRFSAVKRTKPWRDSTDNTQPLYSVYLPVPAALKTGYHNNWGNGEDIGVTGTLGAAAARQVRDLITGRKSIGNTIDTIRSKTADIASDLFNKEVSKAGAMMANFILADSNLLGQLTGGFVQGAKFGLGLNTNPHKAMLFDGVGFRKHTFEYQLTATSEAESNAIKNIIYAFKYHGAPDIAYSDQFFTYPEEFDISFHYPNYLFTFAPSVLTSFGVDYHAAGVPAYFQGTHAPVSVSISLEFSELTIVTKDRIQTWGR